MAARGEHNNVCTCQRVGFPFGGEENARSTDRIVMKSKTRGQWPCSASGHAGRQYTEAQLPHYLHSHVSMAPTGTGKRKVSKVAGQTLDCYCVCCKLLSASKTDALQFVNMVCLPLIAEQNAHEKCLTQECLQKVRRLFWKQTTHSIRNNNPMFDQQPLT